MAQNPSYLSTKTRMDNFAPGLAAKITTGSSSTSVTFSPLTGSQTTTFKITNKGPKGAYLAFGVGTATAVASSGTPAAACDYIGAGAILTQDYPNAGNGPIDTIAAIQGSDTEDNGATLLEITYGYGQ